MQIADKYSPREIESKWYDYWTGHRLFHSEPDQREPYTIVIPPPNVTGMLHMGHMLNNTLQDVLVRRARMSGKNACWVPGMDHASIATEAKVVAMLREKGIEKSSLTREEFLRHAWEWKEKYGGVILKQLRKLGASCDWDRTCFTMDEARTESVLRVFCDLYEKGKIYRGVRMVNWDPAAQTALSDEEVVFKESHGKLYYLRYKVEGTDRAIIVATTRPETILGDTALCVNPNDERYKALPADARVVHCGDCKRTAFKLDARKFNVACCGYGKSPVFYYCPDRIQIVSIPHTAWRCGNLADSLGGVFCAVHYNGYFCEF